ncbi:MAG TPA: aldose 1-epimerase [Thermoleophilaceae bacterium]
MRPHTLRAGPLTATFVPDVGMIGSSMTHEGDELLGQRKGLDTYAETGSTMGIPLLHPWANRLGGTSFSKAGREVAIDVDSPRVRTDANGLPIHGLVNASPHWEVLEAGDAVLSARLDFGAHEDLLAAFPFPHVLRIEAELTGEALTIATTLEATGADAVPVSFGYHPYLVLPGVPRADWHVEVPLTERLVLDERMIPTGATERVDAFDGRLGATTFDDSYAGAGDGTTFALAGGGRRVELELLDGYAFAQVYAPQDEEAVCFEPMTAPADALRSGQGLGLVPPGESRSATFAIRVRRE